jgi:enoyl-CoA hydratase/carnithine racemase
MRVVDARAVFSFVGTRMGLMPVLGSTGALSRLVGPGRAADLLLTARKFRATEALALGIVTRLCEPGSAREEAVRMAQTIAGNGPRAVRATLKVLRQAASRDREEIHELEYQQACKLILSGEFTHAMRAALAEEDVEFPDPD